MTYNRIKLGVGIFILLFFLNVGVVVYYILSEKGIFDERYNYTFSTYSADPFTIGMPVKISGFKIGYIEKIRLMDDGSVKVTFSVNRDNRKWIMKGSIIIIRKPLLGSPQILLYPAVDNPVLADGSKIEVYESNDINDVIYKLKPIVEKMENIVNSVDKITSYLARDDSELVKIVKNLEEFSRTLAKNKSILTTVTGDQKATDSLIETINTLPVLVENINKLSADMNDDIVPEITKFLKELGVIAQDVRSKLQRLDGVVDSVGSYESDIIGLKDDIKTGITKSNEILEKVDTLLPGENDTEVPLP